MRQRPTSLALVAIVFAVASASLLVPPSTRAAGPFQYHAITPCRIVDTRSTHPPSLVGNNPQPRNFQVQGLCAVPVGATAAMVNVTIANPSCGGYLTLWPSGAAMPLASTINFTSADTAVANGAIVPLSTNALDLSVFFGGCGTVHLIIDVAGYFI